MNRYSAVAALVIAGLFLFTACGDGNSKQRTGDESLDAIIKIVETRDTGALRDLVVKQTLPCTHALGMGGPPKCNDAEGEGTEIDVLFFATGELDWRRDDGGVPSRSTPPVHGV
jgi:hypothetical protein